MTIKEVALEQREKPKDIKALVDDFKRSSWFSVLTASTMRDYERAMLMLIGSPYRSKKPEEITPRIAEAIYEQLCKDHGLHTAKLFSVVWGRIYKYAIRNEYVQVNPWWGIKKKKLTPRKVFWTEEQVFQVIEKSLELGKVDLARLVCLLYDTGQRPSDVLKMTWLDLEKDEQGWYVKVTQSKRGAKVNPPLSAYTVGLLALGTPSAELFNIVNGRLSAHQQALSALKSTLGLPKELQLRDLRRTAITEMGAASDDQMVAVSGHSDRGMLNTYSLKNRTKALEAQKIRHETRNSRLNTEFIVGGKSCRC